MLHFFKPWKHQKTEMFSDFFLRGTIKPVDRNVTKELNEKHIYIWTLAQISTK